MTATAIPSIAPSSSSSSSSSSALCSLQCSSCRFSTATMVKYGRKRRRGSLIKCSNAEGPSLRRPSPPIQEATPPLRAPAPPAPPPSAPSSSSDSDSSSSSFSASVAAASVVEFEEEIVPTVTVEFQRQRAKEMQEYFRQKKIDDQYSQSQIFGFIPKNEIANGRWAMFGFAVGLLTEYATGSSFVDQMKILISNFGIADLE